jgi:hypothetical protein
MVNRKVSNRMRRIEEPIRTTPRQEAPCCHQNWPPTALCLIRSSFWGFLELKKKALHRSKVKDVTLYGMSLPSLWRCQPPLELRAAIAAMGPGLVLIFLFDSFTTTINIF